MTSDRYHLRNQSLLVVLALALVACSDEIGPGAAAQAPRILAVTPAQGNVLTARVSLRTQGLDSVRIEYVGAGDGTRRTPALAVHGDSASLLVLGMRAATAYEFHAQGWAGTREIDGDSAGFATDSLPAPLRTFALQLISGTPTGGYTLVPATYPPSGFLVLFDSTSTIRWYVDAGPVFPNAAFSDIKQLANGHFVGYLGTTRGWDPVFGQFYEWDLEGRLVRTYAAPPPLYTDNHDLIVFFDDTVPVSTMLFGYDIRTTDLTAYGGAASVQLAGHQLVRRRLDGTPEFFWNAWDRLSLLDWIEEPQSEKQGPGADSDHPNSVTLDDDSNYVVSWRNLGEIMKINARNGNIMWRWGGRNNQFTFVNDAEGFFSGQHSVKALGNGHYLVYDNGLRHVPPETRVVEYQLDSVAHTATLVWEYHHSPPLFTLFVGWAERLRSGNTFIGWGFVGRVQEVTQGKQTVWEAQLMAGGAPATFYRAVRVADLYRHLAP